MIDAVVTATDETLNYYGGVRNWDHIDEEQDEQLEEFNRRVWRDVELKRQLYEDHLEEKRVSIEE